MTTQTKQLSTFNFENHSIRALVINNQPWFVAKDLCDTLGITNPSKAILNLDDDEKMISTDSNLKLGSAGNGAQSLALVSESGMYTLILRCRDAVKKGSIPHRFRKWVTSEVLPTIRKTGKYQLQPQQKTTVDDRAGLRNAISFLVNKKGLIYSEVYQLIHQQFGVEHIDELSQEQLSQAIKYIHFLTLNLDGLFKKGEEVIIPEYIFDAIMKHAKLAQKLAEKVICYQEKQFALLGIARHYRSNELTRRANSLLSEFSYFLHEGEKLLAQQIENPSLTQIKNIF
ncbi:BRO-N domain-containing protein [Haemophilus influenzae]|uniref:Putative antirepressor protein n=1 Tax=Haemophilus influenzae (strain PittGG) TaxID=374931 RepID=A5UEQ9_HAEIG|nr:Bro-N domain-containing protein [Haemophilus influenzae]ABQ99264.1 putative antirepressor protein [Haemophilus influenzae PittGG]MCK8789217.1 Bro-N domain-containing protein [Haemophilus influenzae]MCK8863005.1 Bro-N domain-containing protein [Haemophilus influenzae]MCK9059869.1 Bro-N domain-containing protein [Haemophilus influenzae]MDO7266095.1 Bro-N domain-containing protein [Haemophilus influenzae]